MHYLEPINVLFDVRNDFKIEPFNSQLTLNSAFKEGWFKTIR